METTSHPESGGASFREMMERMTGGITAATVLGLLFGGFLLFFLLPKQDFSENENRMLQKFPEFSWETLQDGSFMSELQTYLSEHFPARDFFMGLKTAYEKACGRMEINGVYVAEDGYYIERYQEPKNTKRIIDSFTKFTDKIENAEVWLMLAPTAVTVYQEKLPAYAKNADQLAEMERIYEAVPCRRIDVYETLRAEREHYQLYYRYDHHWTTRAAYLAYEAFCEQLGLEYVPLKDRELVTVSENFKGTIYSKVNDYTVEGDSIEIVAMPEQSLSVVYDSSEGEALDTLYAASWLEEKDQYSYFLDNIHPYVEITNENAATDREIVVIKDSYGNCLVPFLANQYRKVYVYDTRYYRRPVSQEINQNAAVTDVLILYNMNTIDTDNGVGGIF